MGATLAALHRLQEVETQLSELRGRIDARWRQVRTQEKKIAQIDADAVTDHNTIRARQMDFDRLDLEVKSRDADIAKLRNALNAAKTNKEYAAVLTELNTRKVDSSKIEDAELAALTALDSAKAAAAARVEQRAAEAARLEELNAAAEAFEKQNKDRLGQLSTKRNELAAAVPGDTLKMFERIAAKHEGKALALVIRTHPKREEFACDGCNMSITLQQVNTLMSSDQPVICNTCGHILYLELGPVSAR